MLLQEDQEAGPSLSANGVAAAPKPVPVTNASLPPGWFEAIDPTYNHPYWYAGHP